MYDHYCDVYDLDVDHMRVNKRHYDNEKQDPMYDPDPQNDRNFDSIHGFEEGDYHVGKKY